jgi:predicted RNA binding protein YcfA (HicA-like mRNA interferase family)
MPSEVPFRQVQKTLENAGYRLARIHSSHHIFAKPGKPLVSIPVHKGKVKAVYVRQVEKIVGEGEQD